MANKVITCAVAAFLILQFISTAVPCDPKCKGVLAGTCLSNGRCLCWWGWTGPNAVYIMSGAGKNRILADYCTNACHYTQVYRNPLCAGIPTPQPQVCSVPTKKTVPAVPCDSLCGTGLYHSAGSCMSNGRCLCWWGWTGPNACYVNGGFYKSRIIADRCVKACHYTHFYKNAKCTASKKPTSLPTTTAQPSTTSAKATQSAASVPCDPRCKGGQGTCQSNGRCLCWWGWTGPNAEYIMSGADKNRILADYCTTACHYTHDYLNPACAGIPTPKVCSVPANKTVPPLPCDPLCGTGTYYSAGQCLSNGRCLCWWGWTGPNACYVDGGTYNNRILADRCDKACHYTHDYRNYNCTSNGTSTAKPSTQPVSTGNLGTGSRTTGQPTTGMSYQSSTNQQTTQIPTTTSPKTSSTTPKQTSTGRPTSVRVPTSNQKSTTSGQTTTVAPTTRQKTTTQRVTTMAKRTTTQVAPTTRQRSTTQGTTTTAAKPTTQAATTTSTTTSTVAQTTKQKTTTQGVSSTTAKATTTQAVTTRAKTTTVSPTTGTLAQTTEQMTTTQAVTTTAKATTTQATTTTEPPEPTEPTEPPEPTEPTEPGVLQVRGMLPNQNQFQDDVDDSEVDDVGDEENQEEEEPNKFSTVALVVVLIVLFVCVTAFVGAVWWTYGNGNQCPSILRGYEPVAGSDVNALTNEFSTSTHLP